MAAVWRLCRHLLGDDASAERAARIALTVGDDRVAAVLTACRGVAGASRAGDQRRALLSLPPAEAEAAVLRLVEDLPYPAIAATLGVPRRVVIARTRAALARLGPGAATALRPGALPAAPSSLGIGVTEAPPTRRRAVAAAALAAALAFAVRLPALPHTVSSTSDVAATEVERSAYGIELGAEPTTGSDDANAIDVQAWIFEGPRDQFAAIGIDLGTPRQVLPLNVATLLQRDVAARRLSSHALPITATAPDGRAYLGSYRSVSLIHGGRPDLPARPAWLGALIDGSIAADGDAVAIASLDAQHARLIGANAPAGARIDCDRIAVAVLHRRATLEGVVALRPDQVLVLSLPATLQRAPAAVPAPVEDEGRLAPRLMVADFGQPAEDAAVVVLKASQRALYESAEPLMAPSSLSRR